ncbi:Splicing factor-like protein 1 [Camellia lanceoleosa]|uniref:Splicing factor-like protein 1 n=1 Tax=Camellia lanceoleosa TaxID=1840588 RepID=A0ACC0J395_9ERIC|nr:Splicing factor-like protein 1 [Camellia lanceoleosa]
MTEELEEEPIEDPDEDPEEDPEEEPEEDPEVGPEEDPEEESDPEVGPEEDPEEEESSVGPDEESVEETSKCVSPVMSYWKYDESKQPVEDPDGNAAKDFASELSSQNDACGTYHQSGSNHNYSEEKKSSLNATSDSDPLQVCQSQKKFRQEDAFKAESDVGTIVTDFHGKSVVSEAILNNESVAKQQEHRGSSGKRRRSRWEPQPEQDGETGEGNMTSKRRKTRWASDVSQLKMLGPIQLPDFMKGFVGSGLDPKIQKLKLRLSELNSKLLSSEFHDDRPEEERSPSPQPVYNNLGIRINTRQMRVREKLIEQRQKIISKLVKKNPTFKTLPDYKPPKLFKKLYIPVKEYPTYNFVGLIIGPRGNTQKRMEKETGARILLRGKGSVKAPQKPDTSSDDEDLHVCIEADNQKSLDAAVTMVEKLLIPIDEGMNGHKQAQLVELAKLKGTYRNENICSVCKEEGHKHYACPLRQSTFKMEITCAMCGSFCHPTSSCPFITSPQVGTTLCGTSGRGSGSVPNTKRKPNNEINDASLYVGYLPQVVDDNQLRELFCSFGKITEVKVIKDRSTGFSKGYGFVTFESPIDAAMAVTHMNGHKMEGKMLAVRVAGRPPPAGLSIMSQLPVYPGPAAISANVPSQTAWPGPPGSMLPEAQATFPNSEDLGLPSSSISLGRGNHLPASEAVNFFPSVVSGNLGSKLSTRFDSFYGYPNQIPFSSPGLMSQFPAAPDYPPGSQLPSYFATPVQKPSSFHFSKTPDSI